MFELKDVLRDFTQRFEARITLLSNNQGQSRSILTDINALVFSATHTISNLNYPTSAQEAEKIRALTHLENLQRFLTKKIIALHQINNDASFDGMVKVLNKYLVVFKLLHEEPAVIATFGTKTAQAEFAVWQQAPAAEQQKRRDKFLREVQGNFHLSDNIDALRLDRLNDEKLQDLTIQHMQQYRLNGVGSKTFNQWLQQSGLTEKLANSKHYSYFTVQSFSVYQGKDKPAKPVVSIETIYQGNDGKTALTYSYTISLQNCGAEGYQPVVECAGLTIPDDKLRKQYIEKMRPRTLQTNIAEHARITEQTKQLLRDASQRTPRALQSLFAAATKLIASIEKYTVNDEVGIGSKNAITLLTQLHSQLPNEHKIAAVKKFEAVICKQVAIGKILLHEILVLPGVMASPKLRDKIIESGLNNANGRTLLLAYMRYKARIYPGHDCYRALDDALVGSYQQNSLNKWQPHERLLDKILSHREIAKQLISEKVAVLPLLIDSPRLFKKYFAPGVVTKIIMFFTRGINLASAFVADDFIKRFTALVGSVRHEIAKIVKKSSDLRKQVATNDAGFYNNTLQLATQGIELQWRPLSESVKPDYAPEKNQLMSRGYTAAEVSLTSKELAYVGHKSGDYTFEQVAFAKRWGVVNNLEAIVKQDKDVKKAKMFTGWTKLMNIVDDAMTVGKGMPKCINIQSASDYYNEDARAGASGIWTVKNLIKLFVMYVQKHPEIYNEHQCISQYGEQKIENEYKNKFIAIANMIIERTMPKAVQGETRLQSRNTEREIASKDYDDMINQIMKKYIASKEQSQASSAGQHLKLVPTV